MIILSHRGYHIKEPENTLSAFSRAIEMGVDGIETDVRLSRDGFLVLFHDRLTPDGYAVSQLTRQDLERSVGYRVPTLEDALGTFSEIFWNIEIKAPSVFDMIIPILEKYAKSTKVLVTSFYHNMANQYVEELTMDWGLIMSHIPMHLSAFLNEAESCHRNLRTVVWNFEYIDRDLISEVKAAGFRIFAYGMKTLAEHLQCKEMALDAVITDFPEHLIDSAK